MLINRVLPLQISRLSHLERKMGLNRVLGNVQKGYAEAYYYDENDRKQEHLKYTGMVTLQKIAITVDLPNDKIDYLHRWFAYLYVGPRTGLNGFVLVGRTNTGYYSRSLALQGLEEAILDIYEPGYSDEDDRGSKELSVAPMDIPDEEEF